MWDLSSYSHISFLVSLLSFIIYLEHMPHRIKKRQAKIQAKRKNTPWRQFVMEIASRDNLTFHKHQWVVTKYPNTKRTWKIISHKKYQNNLNQMVAIQDQWSFFENFRKLRLSFKHRPTIQQGLNENSVYSEMAFWVKNAYLSFTIWVDSENICTSNICYNNCKHVFSSTEVINYGENVYMSRSIFSSSDIFYSCAIKDSNNIRFSSNLIWCSHCIWCSDLQNASYQIKNVQYSKQEYHAHAEKLLHQKNKYTTWHDTMQKKYFNYGNENIEKATSIIVSQDVSHGHGVSYLQGWRNVIFVHGVDRAEHMYDVFDGWSTVSTHFYWVYNAGNLSNHLYCCADIDSSSFLYYCYDLEGCSYCLWCIWLINKSFCIFNKQYTKDERHHEVDKIFTQMEQEWTLWDFFPWSLNPFYFNDTAAYLINDSFTKEEVEAQWYMRRDNNIHVDIPDWVEVVSIDELDTYEWRMLGTQFLASSTDRSIPSWAIRHINPSILKKAIKDEDGNIYRLVKMERDFLIKHWLPIPRKHRLERIKGHVKMSEK